MDKLEQLIEILKEKQKEQYSPYHDVREAYDKVMTDLIEALEELK